MTIEMMALMIAVCVGLSVVLIVMAESTVYNARSYMDIWRAVRYIVVASTSFIAALLLLAWLMWEIT